RRRGAPVVPGRPSQAAHRPPSRSSRWRQGLLQASSLSPEEELSCRYLARAACQMPVLVTFASKHGSTQAIEERIAMRLREMGQDVVIQPVQSVAEVSQYGALVIGSAVYFGSWMKDATDFVRRHRDVLAVCPVWLFSRGPTGDAAVPEPKEIA